MRSGTLTEGLTSVSVGVTKAIREVSLSGHTALSCSHPNVSIDMFNRRELAVFRFMLSFCLLSSCVFVIQFVCGENGRLYD